jgi:predicted RecB family endonuclease
MSTTIALSPDDLKLLIQSAVDEAIEKRLANVLDYIDEEEIVDRNLARLTEEAANDPSPRMSGEEFMARLDARL